MKKLLLILLCFPMIGFSQSYCSLLNVTDIDIDSLNMTINIAVYDGNGTSPYPHAAYSIDAIGDTIHHGYLWLFGNNGFDTTWYLYPINSFPIYPLSIYYVYGMNADTCVLSFNNNSTQTYVPDANFEAYLEANGMGNNIPNDSNVFTSAIDTVTSLTVDSLNIADLTGIEDFTALEYLYCDNNNLTFLNLSSNLLLEEVDCSNNNLTSLVLGSNTPLGEVICSYNQIITLDLSNCPNLDWFECENNALTSLNFRNGNNNGAWVFKVSNNPDLTCIDVDDASWSTANWTFASGNIDPQHYFHGVLESGWVDVGSLSIAAPGASYIRDFIIDTDDIMYVIGGANLSTLRYDPNGTGNWVDIGGLAHKIAVDNNNDLHKVSLDKFYYDPTSPYIYSQTKAALKLMKYNGSGWTLTSVDTIHSDYWNYDFFGAIEIEDFIIDASGNSYVSLLVNNPDIDVMFDYARVHVKKYDGVWSDLDTTGILKDHNQYFSFGTNWYKQYDMKTTLAINPNTGNLLIAGQQGACSQFFPPWYGNVTLTSNVVKEYNGVNWNLLGNAIPIVQLTPGGSRAGGAFL